MKKSLFYFAVTGWTLSLIVHILSLTDIDVTEKIPFVWILHLGLFVVWIPAILELNKNKELKEFRRSGILTRMNPIDFAKIIFKTTPIFLTIIAIAGFSYATINSMLFMTSRLGAAEIKDGQYILQNHGHLIKSLTKQEYYHYKSNSLRGFSGIWIAFYGIATAVLFPFNKLTKD